METVLHLPSHKQMSIQAVLENKKRKQNEMVKVHNNKKRYTIQMTNNSWGTVSSGKKNSVAKKRQMF